MRLNKFFLILLISLPSPVFAVEQENQTSISVNEGSENADAEKGSLWLESLQGLDAIEVTSLSGEVIIARVGDTLDPGDTIITDNKTMVQLRASDGSVIRLGVSSRFTVKTLGSEAPRSKGWGFQLVFGAMTSLVRSLDYNEDEEEAGAAEAPSSLDFSEPEKEQEKVEEVEERWRVETPTAAIGVRGTEFSVYVDSESEGTFVETVKGAVSLSDRTLKATTATASTKRQTFLRAGEIAAVRRRSGGIEKAMRTGGGAADERLRKRFQPALERFQAVRERKLQLAPPIQKRSPDLRQRIQERRQARQEGKFQISPIGGGSKQMQTQRGQGKGQGIGQGPRQQRGGPQASGQARGQQGPGQRQQFQRQGGDRQAPSMQAPRMQPSANKQPANKQPTAAQPSGMAPQARPQPGMNKR